MATKIQLRRDTAANWAEFNPILTQGEPALVLDTGRMKIGDGVTAWNDLPIYEEVNIALANSWVSPQTSNTYSVFHISGAKLVNPPTSNNVNISTYSTNTYTSITDGDYTFVEITVPNNPSVNTIFNAMFNYDYGQSIGLIIQQSFAHISGNTYDFYIAQHYNPDTDTWYYYDPIDDVWWVGIYQLGGPSIANVPVPDIISINDTIDLELYFVDTPQKWFDPDDLGITDFKGAKLSYHAYLDGEFGYSEINDISYVVPNYRSGSIGQNGDVNNDYTPWGLAYVDNPAIYVKSTQPLGLTNFTRVRNRNGSPGDYSDYANTYPYNYDTQMQISQEALFTTRVDNGLAYYNNNYLDLYDRYGVSPSNLHIQWTGTVWTSKDV